MDLSNAEVAVTTQHILDGKEYKDYWVQMSDYSDMGEFLCACSDLFPEEEDPENAGPKNIFIKMFTPCLLNVSLIHPNIIHPENPNNFLNILRSRTCAPLHSVKFL